MKERVVLVAGASRGIGKAIAEKFAQHGDRVFGTARQPESIKWAAGTLLPLDVQEETSVAPSTTLTNSTHTRAAVSAHPVGRVRSGLKKSPNECCTGEEQGKNTDTLKSVADNIAGRTICAFGEACSWPTQSFVAKFRNEFVATSADKENGNGSH